MSERGPIEERAAMATRSPLMPGFFVGGFECSSHWTWNGRRLDLASSTRHVEFAEADYRRLAAAGIRVARDGFAWHRVEPSQGRFDFATVRPLIRAARAAGVRVIWDLLHFGWPDDVDIFVPAFVDRFAALARAFATLLVDEGDAAPWIAPVNEISFTSWAGADVAVMNPFQRGRGFEMKCQLARASIAAIEAVRDVASGTRIVVHDPAYHVVPQSDSADDIEAAEASRMLQFQGCDLLTGRLWPQIGGRPDYIDVLGINYYPWNQWTYGTPVQPGAPIRQDDARHRPLSEILIEWQHRYDRPAYIGETGCEGDSRPAWLRTVCDEVAVARERGADLHGICLYPIVNFPGWDNDRHCENGLWDYAGDDGHRAICEPFAVELKAQQRRFATLERGSDAANDKAIAEETPTPDVGSRWPIDPATIDRTGRAVGGATA